MYLISLDIADKGSFKLNQRIYKLATMTEPTSSDINGKTIVHYINESKLRQNNNILHTIKTYSSARNNIRIQLLEETLETMSNTITELKVQNEELRNMIIFAPGGSGYHSAKASYEFLSQDSS